MLLIPVHEWVCRGGIMLSGKHLSAIISKGLVGVEAGEIELQADGQSHRMLIDDVEQARLVYAF